MPYASYSELMLFVTIAKTKNCYLVATALYSVITEAVIVTKDKNLELGCFCNTAP